MDSQLDRLTRQVKHWKSLYAGGRDVTILGDANLCAIKWNNASYQYKSLSDITQDFLLETSSFQQVREYTRSELSCNGLVRSCIDHCYTDVKEKITGPFVEAVGDSDHLGVRIIKYCRNPVSQPQAIKKRVYKNFCVEGFLSDIFHSNINTSVTSHESIEGASEAFRNEFSVKSNKRS